MTGEEIAVHRHLGQVQGARADAGDRSSSLQLDTDGGLHRILDAGDDIVVDVDVRTVEGEDACAPSDGADIGDVVVGDEIILYDGKLVVIDKGNDVIIPVNGLNASYIPLSVENDGVGDKDIIPPALKPNVQLFQALYISK